MTEPVHPTLDELAELREGVLGVERQPEVSAHIASCPECTRAMAALSEVGTVLTTAGTAPVPMPAHRSAALHDALRRASAERTAGVASLAGRRDRPQQGPAVSRGRVRRWASLAGAAAAVVLVCYGGFSLLNGGPSSTSNAEDSGATAAGGQAAASGQSSSTPRRSPRSFTFQTPGKTAAGTQVVTPKTLGAYATALAGTRPVAARPSCGSAVVDAPRGSRAATVSWKGARALVVVDPSRHRARVYSCRRSGAVLFGTRY